MCCADAIVRCRAQRAATGLFRDTHLRVAGPAVTDLLSVLRSTLVHKSCLPIGHVDHSRLASRANEPVESAKHRFPYRRSTSWRQMRKLELEMMEEKVSINKVMDSRRSMVQILEENTLLRKRHIQQAMSFAFRNARTRIFIATPYFSPPGRLRRAIIRAAKA